MTKHLRNTSNMTDRNQDQTKKEKKKKELRRNSYNTMWEAKVNFKKRR